MPEIISFVRSAPWQIYMALLPIAWLATGAITWATILKAVPEPKPIEVSASEDAEALKPIRTIGDIAAVGIIYDQFWEQSEFATRRTDDGITIHEKTSRLDDEILEHEMIFYEGKEFLADVSAFKVAPGCSWKYAQVGSFEYENGQSCSLKKLLEKSHYRRRLELSSDILLIGVSSSAGHPWNNPDGSVSGEQLFETETSLPERRARALGEVVKSSIKGIDVGRQFWIVDLGRNVHLVTVGNDEEFHQRSVMIIGLRKRRQNTDFTRLINLITDQTRTENMWLGLYQNSGHVTPIPLND